ncbi:MAG: DUF1565 domain-containing protein, partial [Planctomycetes bacterium]|nr:DUF1565 domain-containing protein [Planctomycetota bacterium]
MNRLVPVLTLLFIAILALVFWDEGGDDLVFSKEERIRIRALKPYIASGTSLARASKSSEEKDSAVIKAEPPDVGIANPAAADSTSFIKGVLSANLPSEGESVAALPIARWDVVPFQSFSGSFCAGVVAFHKEGMEAVHFKVGERTLAVKALTRNPRTGIPEYWLRLDAEAHPEGELSLAARAVAKDGSYRDLPPLTLFVRRDSGTTGRRICVSTSGEDSAAGSPEAPLKTLARALSLAKGGDEVVLLDAGRYGDSLVGPVQKKFSVDRWITLRPREGLPEGAALIAPSVRSTLRFGPDKIRFIGLSFDFHTIAELYHRPEGMFWFDRCRWFDSAGPLSIYKPQLIPVRTIEEIRASYATDCLARDMLYGFVHQTLVRGCRVENITGDAFQNSRMVLYSTLDGMDGALLPHHSDVLQYFGHFENVIVFGLRGHNISSTQNFFLDHKDSSFRDMAFVNILLENLTPSPPHSQLASSARHLLFRHITNPSQTWVFRDDMPGAKKFRACDVLFSNCVLDNLLRGSREARLPPGVISSACHFVKGPALGVLPTSGALDLLPAGGGFSFSGPAAQLL